jgi:O-antigen ligase
VIAALGLAAMGLAWLMPGHYFPWTGFQQEALAAAGALLVALAALAAPEPWPSRLPALSLLAWLLALVALLQWAGGMFAYLSDALLPAAYLAGFGLSVMVGQRLCASGDRFIVSLLAVLAIAALISCAFGFAQWAQWRGLSFIHELAPGGRVYANFTQPNHQATLMGLGLVALVGLREAGRIGASQMLAGAAVLLIGLAMTQSRVGWLITAALVLLWLGLHRRAQLKLSGAQASMLLALYGAVWWALPLVTRAAIGSATASMTARAQADSRGLHLQIFWDAVTRSPWLGYGWNQMSAAQQATVLDHPPTFEWPSSSHNQLLDLLVWNGLPIGLAAIAVLAWWSVLVVRRCTDALTWALLAALAVLFAHAIVEFPLAYTYFLLPAGLLAGAVHARIAGPGLRLPFGPPFAKVLASTMVSLSAASLWGLGSEYLRIEEGVRQARFRDAGYGQHVEVPDVMLLDGPRAYLQLWATRNEDGDPGASMNGLRTVALRFATPPALFRYATAAAVRGDAAQAQWALAVMCRTSKPKHCDEGRVQWARLSQRLTSLKSTEYPPTPMR